MGTFSIFALGGHNTFTENFEADSTLWEDDGDAEYYTQTQDVGVIGINHQHLLSKKAYIKTVVASSINKYTDLSTTIDISDYSNATNYKEEPFDVSLTIENETYTTQIAPRAMQTIHLKGHKEK